MSTQILHSAGGPQNFLVGVIIKFQNPTVLAWLQGSVSTSLGQITPIIVATRLAWLQDTHSARTKINNMLQLDFEHPDGHQI